MMNVREVGNGRAWVGVEGHRGVSSIITSPHFEGVFWRVEEISSAIEVGIREVGMRSSFTELQVGH